MTREEAIRELSYIADEMPSMECGDWKEAIYMAIKALEQEPVLDKIRAEIEDRPSCMLSTSSEFERGVNAMLRQSLMIIDKYKAESEDKE